MRFDNLIEALEAAPDDRLFITFWLDEDEQETVTFSEFRDKARLQARLLQKHGIESGDRVIVIMPQGIAVMASFVGIMMLGAVPAFLAYPNFKVEAEKYRSGLLGVTANLKAKAVIIDGLFPDDMLAHVSLGNEAKLIRAQDTLIERLARPENPDVNSAIAPESLAFIQHSAGTTGLQKGVALSHTAVLRQIEHLARVLKIDETGDRIYSWLPLYHDMGLIACFILPMVCHIPVVMQSPLDWVMRPETMLQIVSEHQCTLAWMPNFALQFIPRRTPRERWAQYDLSSLRALINCSEPVRTSSMTEFQNAFAIPTSVLQSSYAMAENVFAVTQSEIGHACKPLQISADAEEFRSAHHIVASRNDNSSALSLTSSGKLLPNHEVRITSDSGAVLGECWVGEILVKSDCLFNGYYNRPDLTAQVIIDGWYHTGDLGFLWQRELFVVGRKKDLIIIGGENIYPQDIEDIACGHPAIHDGRAVALGVYNPELGTDEIVVVAEVDNHGTLANVVKVEQEIRSLIVAAMGLAVRAILLKPPHWIVKSTAGKAARSATREKLLREHPELNFKSQDSVA